MGPIGLGPSLAHVMAYTLGNRQAVGDVMGFMYQGIYIMIIIIICMYIYI